MILNKAKKVFLGDEQIKKIYCGPELVYSYITSIPPSVSEESLSGSSTADNYVEGSTQWGDLQLSSGCTISEDGIEIQDQETYLSSKITGMSYPMTFEFKGRLDPDCYRAQAYNPGMLFGLSPTQNGWGNGITCYSTTDYGIIIDTTSEMRIVTYAQPTYVHIIFTINRSGTLTFYLNGINNTWTAMTDRGTRAQKNYIYNGQGNGRFVGAINTMRWWTKQLSKNEIAELFSQDSEEYTTLN